jgi:hypothetical protein
MCVVLRWGWGGYPIDDVANAVSVLSSCSKNKEEIGMKVRTFSWSHSFELFCCEGGLLQLSWHYMCGKEVEDTCFTVGMN